MNFPQNNIKQLLQQADRQKQVMLSRCQRGEREAFRQFIQTYQDDIYTHVYHRLNDDRTALEVTRAIFVAAYADIQAYRGEPTLDVWLFDLVERQIQQELRQHKLSSPDLTCGDVSDLLMAYLDGELSASETQQVEQHLEHCDRCRQEYEELQTTETLLHLASRKRAPAELLRRIDADLGIASKASGTKRLFLFDLLADHLHELANPRALALAASLLIIFSGILFYRESQYLRTTEELHRQIRTARGNAVIGDLPGTFVIATGVLSPDKRALADARFVASLAPEPEQTIFLYMPGSIEQVVTQLAEQIPPRYWQNRQDELSQQAHFHIRKIQIDLPANITTSFAQFLQAFQETPATIEQSTDVPTSTATFYIVAKPE